MNWPFECLGAMNLTAPWNATWTGESRYEIRPCRWADGALAIWQPHKPGEGRPIFAEPHVVRQRKSVKLMLCTVCGKLTPLNNRWWFAMGQYQEQWFMTTEAPVHKACADYALTVCPLLKRKNCAQDLTRFPRHYQILASLVGGEEMEKTFGLGLHGRTVVGHLKIAWPRDRIRVIRRD